MARTLRRVVGGAALAAALLAHGSRLGAQADGDLIAAIKNRDLEQVRLLLDQRADVNARGADGATALHWAAYWDNRDLVAQLLKLGAEPGLSNDLGVTPLGLASANGNAAIVDALLAAGADTRVSQGVPPLMSAARVGSVDAVQTLLAHGADVNVREPGANQTALMWAIAQQHDAVVAVLLQHHADVNARSAVTRLTINRGGPIGSTERPVIEDINRGGSTPLLFAARVGDLRSAQLLLDAGANVNDTLADGTSALLLAAHSGHGQVAEFLLSRGANPNLAGAGYAPLHAAVLMGDRQLVGALLARHANPNVQQAKGNPVRRTGEDLVLPNSLVGSTAYYLAACSNLTDYRRARDRSRSR